MRDLLENVNSQIESNEYHIEYIDGEFVFSELQYGVDVHSETLIVALMRMDRQEAYYAALRAEEAIAREREAAHFKTVENGDFDYIHNF